MTPELKDAAEKEAERYWQEELERNPEGWHVSSYCNQESIPGACMHMAQWLYDKLCGMGAEFDEKGARECINAAFTPMLRDMISRGQGVGNAIVALDDYHVNHVAPLLAAKDQRIRELEQEVERLKEYEFMYKGLDK